MILRKILAGVFWIVLAAVGFFLFPLYLTISVALLSDGLADAVEDDGIAIAGLLVLVTISQLSWFVYLSHWLPQIV